MCRCAGVEVGSYGNQVVLQRPACMEGRSEGSASPTICVDACLEEEIRGLWQKGIRTTGCCCGHNKGPGYIGAVPEDIPSMKALGYEVQCNPHRPDAEDTFWPKSLSFPKRSRHQGSNT